MTEQQLEEKIREMIEKSDIPYPNDYDRYIQSVLDKLPEKEKGKKHAFSLCNRKRYTPLYVKTALAVMLIAILVAGTPVGAVVYGYLQRLEKMGEEQREEYVETLYVSKTNGDSYSREFSKEEKKRMDELSEQYTAGEAYPADELCIVHKKTEVEEDKVCFWDKNSRFYLPERQLSDGELLEIIDFLYRRDYSLVKRQQEEGEEGKDQSESADKNEPMLSEDEVSGKAQDWIEKVFEEDVSDWKKSVRYHVSQDCYYVEYQKEISGKCYEIKMTADQGECLSFRAYDYQSDTFRKNRIPSKKELENLSLWASEILDVIEPEWEGKTIYAQYVFEQKQVPYGTIDFVVENKESDLGYIMKYSCNLERFYCIERYDDIPFYLKQYNNRNQGKKIGVYRSKVK